MGLGWSFIFKDEEEKKRFFNHAKSRNRSLAQLFRDLMEFDIAGVNPYQSGENLLPEITDLFQKKIDLLENTIAEMLKVKWNEFLLSKELKDVDISENQYELVLSVLKEPRTLVQLQDLTKIETNFLIKILNDLIDKGEVKLDWRKMIYSKSEK